MRQLLQRRRLRCSLIGIRSRLAFKTGTSYGFRDALAAAIAGGYVIVVWTGRPDGGARPGLTGREAWSVRRRALQH